MTEATLQGLLVFRASEVMTLKYDMEWQSPGGVPATVFTCGFCGSSVAPNQGWLAIDPRSRIACARIQVCHSCKGPTFFDPSGRQFPGTPFGDEVAGIADRGIAGLYEEARRATAANAYTAAVLCCRKVLMHVAVEKGAQPGEPFVKYVEHLAATGFIPPGAREWVDHIRTKSNEANHEIVVMSSTDAEELLSFTGMLLKVVYEFPATMRKKVSPKPAP